MALCDDLKHIQEFLTAQRDRVEGAAWKRIAENQANALASRIRNSAMAPEECSRLTTTLSAGPWHEDHFLVISEAIAQKLAGTQNASNHTGRRANQGCDCFATYLSHEDVAMLQGEAHRTLKIQRVVAKMVDIGLHLPSEQAMKLITKTVADCASAGQCSARLCMPFLSIDS